MGEERGRAGDANDELVLSSEMIRAAMKACEDAGLRGLCPDGRSEAVIAAVAQQARRGSADSAESAEEPQK